ncbi:Chemotaxis protein CheY [compost metagenome]
MAALEAAPEHYDLLVTDYNMPGFCGVDLVRAAAVLRPELPVALASGYVTAEIEAQALAAGARALIHKPNDVEELCTTVDQLMHTAARN